MTARLMKYNPSFLADQELVDSFVVRLADFELIMEVIRENAHASNQHLLLIGPRGSGKTTLARRVVAEIRRSPEYGERWFPVPFGEESYEVASAGQFWLEAVLHLGGETGDPKWTAVYEDLRREPDEKRLEQRSLGILLDFADSVGKRLLVVVENLNLMFGEQVPEDDAWSLRRTLMQESRIMLLGSAVTRFDAISQPNQAMYELFRILELEPLSVEECQAVWRMTTGREIPPEKARAVRILTGGNPRLLAILAAFGAERSFRSLMEDLALLVDDHTEYFKSNFESLPTTERKVFACLAAIWEDATAAEVARAARMTASQVSAMLKRLEGRGAVKAIVWRGGKKRYQLAERLYNIYYLMRRGQDEGRVRAVVNFMVQFYGGEGLHEAAADIAREACGLDADHRRAHCLALRLLLSRPEAKGMRERIFAALPPEFLQLPDVPEDLKRPVPEDGKEGSPEFRALMAEYERAAKDERWADVEMFLRWAWTPVLKTSWLLIQFVMSWYSRLGQVKEGEAHLRKAMEKMPDTPSSHGSQARVLALYGHCAEALEHAAVALGDPKAIETDIQEPTDVLTTAAAAGLGRQALDLLEASPSLHLLEPLAVALRLHLGLEVKAPQEVREVAEDVVKRIEYWRDWHAQRGTTWASSSPSATQDAPQPVPAP